jgi:uncharacterized repeat protein (TIGR01451 family)
VLIGALAAAAGLTGRSARLAAGGLPGPLPCVPVPEAVVVLGVPDPPPPVVAIRVRVPAVGGLGQELEYRICVENCSAAPAHHVTVRDRLPPNARYVRAVPEPAALDPEMIWSLGTLPGGACREICLVLTPSGPGSVTNCARVQFEHGECVCTKVAGPGVAALRLQKDGPGAASLNEVLTYRLTVTNVGEREAVGVVVTDSLPAALEHASRKNTLTWDFGSLLPGQGRTAEYQVVARQVGRHGNGAVATAAGGVRQEVEHWVVVGEAKLVLAMAGPTRRYVSQPATYQLTVTNPGSVPLPSVVITNPLPPGTTFVGSRGGQLGGAEVRWLLGALEPGGSRTVDVTLRARQPGEVRNRAAATAAPGLRAEAEAATDFFGVTALLLEVVDSDDPVEVGGATSYIVLVRNQGTLPATEVRVTAQVPAEMEVTRVTANVAHKRNGQTIAFDPTTLLPQGEGRYVIYVKAKAPGDVRFKAELSAKELTSGPIQEEESTTIYAELRSEGPGKPAAARQAGRGKKP